MNIELQVKNLFANASQLDEAGFVADFYFIAKEYARQQNGAKLPVMRSLPPAEVYSFAEWISYCELYQDETNKSWYSTGGELYCQTTAELLEAFQKAAMPS